jgi:hypothetical protein
MMAKWVAELKEKTGRSLEEWLALVKEEGPATEAERREWLKKKHGLGTNAAWWIAERAAGRGWEESDPQAYLKVAEKYVEAMFAGKRAGLRPIYDKLLELGLGIGSEAKACPCQTIVPLYRNHVFAQIRPATNSRIDFGYCFKGYQGKLPKRLVPTGGAAKGNRITHAIAITAPGEIDAEVKRWLKTAYDLDR